MMWEPSVVAAQVEPYVTDYRIDTVSSVWGQGPVDPVSKQIHSRFRPEPKLTRTQPGDAIF